MKILSIILLLLLALPVEAAKQCPSTPFRHAGARCADLGLDTDRAVCRPGDRFATYCDDKGGGYLRTCTSAFRCDAAGRDEGRRPDRDHRGDAYPYHPDYHDHRDHPYPDRYYEHRPLPRPGPGYGLVPYRGYWYRCDALRYDRRGRVLGFCAYDRRNIDCRGRCEGY